MFPPYRVCVDREFISAVFNVIYPVALCTIFPETAMFDAARFCACTVVVEMVFPNTVSPLILDMTKEPAGFVIWVE